MIHKLPATAALATLTLALTGCGQKGPLYLPQQEQPQQKPSPRQEQQQESPRPAPSAKHLPEQEPAMSEQEES